MIVLTAYPIHEPDVDREQRVDEAEDRAAQAALDIARGA